MVAFSFRNLQLSSRYTLKHSSAVQWLCTSQTVNRDHDWRRQRRQYCLLDSVNTEASMKMCLWLTKHPAYKIVPINEYEKYLTHCLFVFLQNPREADAMTKVQAELDETKIILVKYFPKL